MPPSEEAPTRKSEDRHESHGECNASLEKLLLGRVADGAAHEEQVDTQLGHLADNHFHVLVLLLTN